MMLSRCGSITNLIGSQAAADEDIVAYRTFQNGVVGPSDNDTSKNSAVPSDDIPARRAVVQCDFLR